MLVERHSIRAILLTPEREILLMRIRSPQGGDWFWITPGGGLEPGEAAEAGLRRELREELGLEKFDLGPLVWRRMHTFKWGEKHIRQSEQYYIVQAAKFEPHMSDPVEVQVLDQFRWWAVTELATTPERLTPLSLATIVTRYLTDGPPSEPPEMEILVD